MALSDYLKRGQIGPSLKGQFYQYERNGRWVTAKWPKKRGKPRSEKQKLAQDMFADACRAMKRTASEIQMFHRENAKGTPMLPRDSLMAALYGNGPTLTHYNGKVVKPMSNKFLASTVLDAIGWAPGTLLYRGKDTWEVLPPGPDGSVLSFSEGLDAPAWVAPGVIGGARPFHTVPYRASDAGNSTAKVNVYQFATLLTLKSVWIPHDTPNGQSLGLGVAFLDGDNKVTADIWTFPDVFPGDGNFRIDQFSLPVPITIPVRQRFIVWLARSFSSALAPVRTFTGADISTNIPGSREVYKWWTSSVVIGEGATISASSTGPYAYTLEFD